MPPVDDDEEELTCMICMGQMHEFWTPDTFCECLPPVHQDCWGRWAAHKRGEICIICREGFYWDPPPPPLMLVIRERARDEFQLRQILFLMLFLWTLYITIRANWTMSLHPMPGRIRDDL